MERQLKLSIVAIALAISSYSFAQGDHRGRYDGRHLSGGGASFSVVTALPFGAVALSLGNERYHYYHGTFYRPVPHGYAIIPAPMGIVVPMLPPGSVSIAIGARNYFRFGGVFYLPLETPGYQTVPAPAGSDSAATQASSTGYEKMEIEGKTYYKQGGKVYKASVTEKGEVVYQEVGKTVKQ